MELAVREQQIQNAYDIAREQYAALGVDVGEALRRLEQVSISLHCWQGDDVSAFEGGDRELWCGLAVTGGYPCRSRIGEELRRALYQSYALIRGTHRLNLHAIYAETGGKKVERDELQPEHFSGWVDWARERGHG